MNDPLYQMLDLLISNDSDQSDIVALFTKKNKTHREKIIRDLKVKSLMEVIAVNSAKFLALEDQRQNHLEDFSIEQFYQSLKLIKDDHRHYDEELDRIFSGEEAHGRVLDLNQLYSIYLNIPKAKASTATTTYLNFIRECDNFTQFTIATKKSPEYSSYLDQFLQYLEYYFSRAMPLFDIESLKIDSSEQFNELWMQGGVPGFEKADIPFDAATFCTPCQKQFTNFAIFNAHLSGKKHLKAVKRQQSAEVNVNLLDNDPLRPIAFSETLLKSYLAVLDPIRRDSFMRVEAKSMLTESERQALIDPEEAQAIDDIPDQDDVDDVDEEKIYNPLKLPLGWDGKPIPYWLYKLHGLGVEYECEICGGFVYKGRKGFDAHFTEARHGWGLKCLGILNCKALRGVTGIDDAYAVWEKVEREKKEGVIDGDVVEEFEDQEGNVYSKKIYDDLKRQGLI